MQASSPKCVVLGLGNILHSDDGVGPYAVISLKSDARVPEAVALIEGGTLGLDLLPYVRECCYLLVLDAVDVGQPPGTLVRMSAADLHSMPGKGNVHQLGVADLLTALRMLGNSTPEVVLLGIQPATTEWGTTLSSPVEAALSSLVDAAIAELCRLQSKITTPT